MFIDPKAVWADIQTIRNQSPLIHNITNYVVMEQTANCLLAIGASPIMAQAVEEVAELAGKANCLVLNIGTLSPIWVEGMHLALKAAETKCVPVVFDPVGSGATKYRTEVSQSLLKEGGITAIRGNASEILSLNEQHHFGRGADSHLNPFDYLEEAKEVARTYQCIVWMSGETDVITDGKTAIFVSNGHAIMKRVTGMGCTASALTGAFLAINPQALAGCVHAAILMGIVGELTAIKREGPGSFKTAFIDTLYQISFKDIEARICVEIR